MPGALRQAAFEEPPRGNRPGRYQELDRGPLGEDPFNERHHRICLADARRMDPHQWSRRTGRRGDTEALVEALRVLLAVPAPRLEVELHERRRGSCKQAVERGPAVEPLSRIAGEGGGGWQPAAG